MSKMHIFMSHNKDDSKLATCVVTRLRDAGADVWYDEHNFGLTKELEPTIMREMSARRVFIVILSPSAVESKWVEEECVWYYREFKDDPPRMILPILVGGISAKHIWVILRGFPRVEAATAEEAATGALTELNRAIEQYYPVHVADAIRKRYEEVGGASSLLGTPLLVDRDAANSDKSQQGSRGYRRFFSGGNGSASIYWSERGGAQPVWGAIRQRYDGRGSRYGFPLTGELVAGTSPQGTNGVYQRFEGSWNYPPGTPGEVPYGATIYCREKHGAHTTWGGIGEYYERRGGTVSDFGFPTSEETEVTSVRGTHGWMQHYEGGSIHWCESAGAHGVFGAIGHLYRQHEGNKGSFGFPLTDEFSAASSRYGTEGVCQRFERTWTYPDDVVELLAGVPCGATIYFSERYHEQPTWGGIGVTYERLHGTAGALGFPISTELRAAPSSAGNTGVYQRFEGGCIYYCKVRDESIPVLGAIQDLFDAMGGTGGQFGFPLAAEEPSPTGGPGGRSQRFEGGIIAVTVPHADGDHAARTE